MTELGYMLARLGLSQYLDRFIKEGFETRDTLLDITESDLYVSHRCWPDSKSPAANILHSIEMP
jgi:hypothetical protein